MLHVQKKTHSALPTCDLCLKLADKLVSWRNPVPGLRPLGTALPGASQFVVFLKPLNLYSEASKE